jgi:hypothetical protein
VIRRCPRCGPGTRASKRSPDWIPCSRRKLTELPASHAGKCRHGLMDKDPSELSDSILNRYVTAGQWHCMRCAPGETRTPNLLIRSRGHHPVLPAICPWTCPFFGFTSKDVHGRPQSLMYQLMQSSLEAPSFRFSEVWIIVRRIALTFVTCITGLIRIMRSKM